jgi:hypothetical protein
VTPGLLARDQPESSASAVRAATRSSAHLGTHLSGLTVEPPAPQATGRSLVEEYLTRHSGHTVSASAGAPGAETLPAPLTPNARR